MVDRCLMLLVSDVCYSYSLFGVSCCIVCSCVVLMFVASFDVDSSFVGACVVD